MHNGFNIFTDSHVRCLPGSAAQLNVTAAIVFKFFQSQSSRHRKGVSGACECVCYVEYLETAVNLNIKRKKNEHSL